ncbi:MAG: hypothetical protein LUC83_04685, partial [Clostridiales bacterium]|nr:hypothetical protein [Clostridiales bacterium]
QIVISKGITLDLNGYTVSSSSTLSNIIKVSGGTESVPVMITDNQASDHSDAGTVVTRSGISVGTGYTQIEKINIETELTDYQSAAGIYCAATSAVLPVKGVNIAVESTSSIDNPVLSGVYVAAGNATVSLMDDDDAESFPMTVSVKASSGTVQAVYNAYDTSNVSVYGGYYEVSSTKTRNSATLNIVSRKSGCSIYDGYFMLKDTDGVTI